jgi:hypothetical protein
MKTNNVIKMENSTKVEDLILVENPTLVESEIKIYVTKEYDRFKVLKGNRPVESKHINQILKSYHIDGALLSIVVVNEKFEIIDGQHRFEVQKRMRLPVNFIIMEGYSRKECQVFNAIAKKWSTQMFINSFVGDKNVHYLQLDELMKRYEFLTINIASNLLMTKCTSNILKQEKFVTDGGIYLEACEIASKMRDIINLFPVYTVISKTNFLYRALVKMIKHPEYNHQRMMEKFNNESGSFRNCANEQDYRRYFTSVYNRNIKKDTNTVSF